MSEDRTPCGQALSLSHAHALMLLLDRDEARALVLQKELANALGLDKSSVARLCARMEAAGHVVQKRSEADGRAREIELTSKGERVAKQVEKESRARFGRIVAAIPARQRRAVVEALKVLNAAVQALGAAA